MPFIEVETQSLAPWVLIVHKTTHRDGQLLTLTERTSWGSEADAIAAANRRKADAGVYLIELMVDAGCLFAIG